MHLCEAGGWSHTGKACSASVVGLGQFSCAAKQDVQRERIKFLQAALSHTQAAWLD